MGVAYRISTIVMRDQSLPHDTYTCNFWLLSLLVQTSCLGSAQDDRRGRWSTRRNVRWSFFYPRVFLYVVCTFIHHAHTDVVGHSCLWKDSCIHTYMPMYRHKRMQMKQMHTCESTKMNARWEYSSYSSSLPYFFLYVLVYSRKRVAFCLSMRRASDCSAEIVRFLILCGGK